MTEEVAQDAHHIAYTRMKNGKIESISSKGFNPKEDKALRVHVGKSEDSHMRHIAHVSTELDNHIVSDPKTKQPFSVGPPKEIYEENDHVMIAGYDKDDVLKRHFFGEVSDHVIEHDISELQNIGDLSPSNSDEISDYVTNHYNEHIGSLGFVQNIIPASENESGEDLYGVVSVRDHDADGDHHAVDEDGVNLNRNHLHYYKASDLLPANPNKQGEHAIKKAEGNPKPHFKYIRRELVNGEYRYIYELPNGEHAAFSEEGYLNWIKAKRDDILNGDLTDSEGFSTWRDPETGELNLAALEELDDEDLVAYGGAIAQNYHQDEWIDHLQEHISLQDAESIKPFLAKSDEQINHLSSLLKNASANSIATAKNKTPIELAAVHMDASGMLMRERNGKIHPDKLILNRFQDGFLETSDETKKLADVLSDYTKKMGKTELTMKNINKYQPQFQANPKFDDMFHLTAFESLKMLASVNDRAEDAKWDREDVQKSLSRGKVLIDKGQVNLFLSQEDKDKELEEYHEHLLKVQKNRDLTLPKTINENVTPKFWQNQHVNWMDEVGNGINGADTSQGKTFEAILLTEKNVEEKQAEGAIIFTLNNLLEGWEEEIELFVKDGKNHHVVYEKADTLKGLSSPEAKNKKYIVLHYSAFQEDPNNPETKNLLKAFKERSKNRKIFFDEGYGLKDEDNAIYQNLAEVLDDNLGVITLNATPMSGKPRQLHSKMALLQPGLLPDWLEFKRIYTKPVTDATGKEIDRVWDREKTIELFNKTLKPYIYMRYNDEPEIAAEMNLPKERPRTFRVEMTDFQKQLYDGVLNSTFQDLVNRPLDEKAINAMNEKHRLLQQISFHPRLVSWMSDDPEFQEQMKTATSAKWEGMLDGLRIHFELQKEKVAKGQDKIRGALIPIRQVGAAPYMAEYFAEQLGLDSNRVAYITGSVSLDMRKTIRRKFNSGGIDVLILGQEAGGRGTNYQGNCSYTAEGDDGWSADSRKQYLNRVRRMGNNEPYIDNHVFRDPKSYDSIMEQKLLSTGEINEMFLQDTSSTPTVSTEDDYLTNMMAYLEYSNKNLGYLNKLRKDRHLAPHSEPPLKKALSAFGEGLDELDNLLLAYSHPVRRAMLGQEKWDEIRAVLRDKASRAGKPLYNYLYEEVIIDLDDYHMDDFQEGKLWMTH